MKNLQARTLPHSVEAEQALLGCILISEDFDILDAFRPADFYVTSHQHIFDAMKQIYETGVAVDFITLTAKLEAMNKLLEVGGISYVANLTNIVPSAANWEYYADIVKSNAKQRRLIKVSERLIDKAYQCDKKEEVLELVQVAEKEIFSLTDENESGGLEAVDCEEILTDYEKMLHDTDFNVGVKTGFYAYDKILGGGLKKGRLYIIGGRPAMGKSAMAINIGQNVALNGGNVAIFSLEMPKKELAMRMAFGMARITKDKYNSKHLTEKELHALKVANATLKDAKILVDDNSLNTPISILSKCRRAKKERGGLDLVVVDYLQLMNGGKKENRQQEISEISRMMKIMARELDCAVICVSQLSRSLEARADKRPLLSDLRESGSIEQDADVVTFVYREDYYKETNTGTAEWITAKNRDGEPKTALVKFIGEYTLFANLDKDSNMASLEEVQIDIF